VFCGRQGKKTHVHHHKVGAPNKQGVPEVCPWFVEAHNAGEAVGEAAQKRLYALADSSFKESVAE
jgi:hypothetical protein